MDPHTIGLVSFCRIRTRVFLETCITILSADFENAEDYFFWRANHFMGHFKGYFEGAKTFLTPKLSRAQLRNIRKRDIKVKNSLLIFQHV
jgi:hypothetical protein